MLKVQFKMLQKNSLVLMVCVCAGTRARVLSHLSHVRLFATLWTVAHQAPLSMGFSRQEYWSGLLFPSPVIAEGSIKAPCPQ